MVPRATMDANRIAARPGLKCHKAALLRFAGCAAAALREPATAVAAAASSSATVAATLPLAAARFHQAAGFG